MTKKKSNVQKGHVALKAESLLKLVTPTPIDVPVSSEPKPAETQTEEEPQSESDRLLGLLKEHLRIEVKKGREWGSSGSTIEVQLIWTDGPRFAHCRSRDETVISTDQFHLNIG